MQRANLAVNQASKADSIQRAKQKLPSDLLMELNRISVEARAATNAKADKLITAVLCYKAGEAWFKAITSHLDAGSEESSILLSEMVILYYGMSSSYFYGHIKGNKNVKLDLTCYKQYLKLISNILGLYYRLDSSSLIGDEIHSMQTIIDIFNLHYGAKEANQLVLEIMYAMPPNYPLEIKAVFSKVALKYQSIAIREKITNKECCLDKLKASDDIIKYNKAIYDLWSDLDQLKDIRECLCLEISHLDDRLYDELEHKLDENSNYLINDQTKNQKLLKELEEFIYAAENRNRPRHESMMEQEFALHLQGYDVPSVHLIKGKLADKPVSTLRRRYKPSA